MRSSAAGRSARCSSSPSSACPASARAGSWRRCVRTSGTSPRSRTCGRGPCSRTGREALAADRAAVLVVEDLHWADEVLFEFLEGLVDRISAVPLLVVCTARPELWERRPGWGGGKPNALAISLQPLSEAETHELIAAL